jgi:hypothetical protein
MTAAIRVEPSIGKYPGGSAVRLLIEQEASETMCRAAQGACRWSWWLGIRFAIRSYVVFWIHRIPPKATLTIREVYLLGCKNDRSS